MKLPIMHPVVKVPCKLTQPYSKDHPAVDYSYSGAYRGKLRAPFPGVVVVAKATNTTAGTVLIIKGTGLYVGLYWFDYHIDTLYVKVGQTVKAGQTVALIGFTGYCIPANKNGSHLHFGICSKLLDTKFPNKSTCYNPEGEKFKIYTDLDAYTKAVAAIQTNEKTSVKIIVDWLYIRKGPGTVYKHIDKALKGEEYFIFEKNGTWGRIGTNRWISIKGKYVKWV
jgi:murein DD-endopeptidase MepM/ murein hydrolase activator NlpD